MASIAYLIQGRFGTYDRSMLQWFVKILEKHRGPSETRELLNTIKRLAALGDERSSCSCGT